MAKFGRHEARSWAMENLRGVNGCVMPSFTADQSALNEAAIRHDVRRERELGFTGFLIVGECGTTRQEFAQFVDICVDEAGADLVTIMIPTLIQGVAMACFFIPLMAIALSGLTPERIASASGLTNFARICAGSFGTSIATTMWDHRASLHHSQLVEHLEHGSLATSHFLDSTARVGLTAEQSLVLLNHGVDTQAFTLAAADIFYLSALLFVALIGIAWMTRPPRGGLAAGAEGGGH